MKKSLAILASSIMGLSAASAQDLEVTVTVGAESQYVFRGAQVADSIATSSIDIAIGGFYAGIWGAFPLTGSDENEIDYYAGFVFPVADFVSLDVGFIYYTNPMSHNLFRTGGDFETFVGASIDLPFAPSAYVYYEWESETWTIELAAGESWEIAPQTSLDLGVFGGLVSPKGYSDVWYYGISAGVTYNFTETASVSVVGNFSGSDSNLMSNGRNSKAWLGASFSIGF